MDVEGTADRVVRGLVTFGQFRPVQPQDWEAVAPFLYGRGDDRARQHHTAG